MVNTDVYINLTFSPKEKEFRDVESTEELLPIVRLFVFFCWLACLLIYLKHLFYQLNYLIYLFICLLIYLLIYRYIHFKKRKQREKD